MNLKLSKLKAFKALNGNSSFSTMGGWANLNFQEEATVLFCHLVSFHDFTLLVLRIILAFVSLVIFSIVQKTGFISKVLRAHHALEFI